MIHNVLRLLIFTGFLLAVFAPAAVAQLLDVQGVQRTPHYPQRRDAYQIVAVVTDKATGESVELIYAQRFESKAVAERMIPVVLVLLKKYLTEEQGVDLDTVDIELTPLAVTGLNNREGRRA